MIKFAQAVVVVTKLKSAFEVTLTITTSLLSGIMAAHISYQAAHANTLDVRLSNEYFIPTTLVSGAASYMEELVSYFPQPYQGAPRKASPGVQEDGLASAISSTTSESVSIYLKYFYYHFSAQITTGRHKLSPKNELRKTKLKKG